MDQTEPVFPPLLNGVQVAATTSAFVAAVRKAVRGEVSAGDLVWSRGDDRMDVAIVLEPDVPAGRAALMLYTVMVALGDCFGALAPPEIGLYYKWPGKILVNSGEVGEARIAMAETRSGEPPTWLVVGVTLRLLPEAGEDEPGLNPDRTNLWEEGCGELTCLQLVESFSRHLLTWINTWEDDGFKPVHETWVARAQAFEGDYALDWNGARLSGRFMTLDEGGNMLLKTDDGTRSLDVMRAVEPAEAVLS